MLITCDTSIFIDFSKVGAYISDSLYTRMLRDVGEM